MENTNAKEGPTRVAFRIEPGQGDRETSVSIGNVINSIHRILYSKLFKKQLEGKKVIITIELKDLQGGEEASHLVHTQEITSSNLVPAPDQEERPEP